MSLKDIEVEIIDSLGLLLSGEIQIGTYVNTVQYLKAEGQEISILEGRNLTVEPDEKKIIIPCSISPETSALTENNIESPYPTSSDIPKILISPSTGMEFVLIPAGKFIMGYPSSENSNYGNAGPTHEVTIKNSFYLGKYPVTQKQWEIIMRNNHSNFEDEDRPVESISWEYVQRFVKKLNEKEQTNKYRLPSEAEWEYTCRAGTTTKYYFGNDESKLGGYAWYDKNSDNETHPVGQKKPNLWDLYDMHGNIWEWVQDRWHDNYEGAPSDGNAWEDGNSSDRVIRGGSWISYARHCLSAIRHGFYPGSRSGDVGFRLLRKL